MSAVRDAPEVLVKNLVRDAWDETFFDVGDRFTPSVHMGWVDPSASVYEITVDNPEESPINAGETGYSGIDPTGAGPIRQVSGTVEVNCWADRDRADVNGVSLNPRKAIYLMKAQVEHLLRTHALGTDAADQPTDFAWFSPLGSQRFVETEAEPTMYRYLVLAGYGYRDEP